MIPREHLGFEHDNAGAGWPLKRRCRDLSPCALALDRALAVAGAQHLARSIDAQQVDASGADLSEVRIEQLDDLSGTIWTDQTIWPPGTEDQVRTYSREIRPGVYQVRYETSRTIPT